MLRIQQDIQYIIQIHDIGVSGRQVVESRLESHSRVHIYIELNLARPARWRGGRGVAWRGGAIVPRTVRREVSTSTRAGWGLPRGAGAAAAASLRPHRPASDRFA
ncbi:unnamed protein product [Colias eurytheme]|nr:unnamed protein product [Colias eurytheme]